MLNLLKTKVSLLSSHISMHCINIQGFFLCVFFKCRSYFTILLKFTYSHLGYIVDSLLLTFPCHGSVEKRGVSTFAGLPSESAIWKAWQPRGCVPKNLNCKECKRPSDPGAALLKSSAVVATLPVGCSQPYHPSHRDNKAGRVLGATGLC